MKLNKSKNLSKNVIYGLIYKIISILFPFVIRTVIINVLSSQYLGLNSLFTSILHALNLMEVGLGSALVFDMYQYVATNDTKKLSNYLAYYKKCYRIIGSVILVVGLILLPFIDELISGTYPTDINIYLLYLIYLINTVLTYWLFSYKNSIALAYQRTDIESNILIVNQTIMYVLQVVILLLFKNYYLYIILMPIFTIIKNLLVSYKIDKTYPEIREYGNITKEEQAKNISNIKVLFGHQIAFTVINSADNIILSAMLGLNELAIYNNYYYVLNALISIMTLLFSSIQAGIGNSIILDDKEIVYKNYKRFRLFIFMLTCCFTNCLICLYQPFMKLWMGEKYLLSNLSVIIFSLGFYITQTRRVITTHKNAAGMWKQDFLKPYIWIVLDIILDLILIPKIGAIGAMIATIISALLVAIPWENYVIYKHLFNKKITEQYCFFAKEFLILILSAIVTIKLTSILELSLILQMIYNLIMASIVSITLNVLFHIRNEEFIWLIEYIKKYLVNFNRKIKK